MTRIAENNTAVFDKHCSDIARGVEEAIEQYFAAWQDRLTPTLGEAMLYSLRAGGKRLRPIILVLACEACGKNQTAAMPAAAAIEMIHTYSLIHDDLPAMDNDDLRRGKATNHKVFGDAVAILAGDALVTLAFHVLALHIDNSQCVRRLVIELADAAGAPGMISGQIEDLENEGVAGTIETVQNIHMHKTAMLFRAAARMGGMCALADESMIDALGQFGVKLGLAFQIIDDLLDVTASCEQLGKQTQKDQTAGKLTYPAIVGIEQSRQQVDELICRAIAALDPLGQAAEPLKLLTRSMTQRTN